MVALGLLLAQALAAQAPSSSPVAAVAPSTDTVAVSTPVAPAPVPAEPLRAPVLLRQDVAFFSPEAARIEWETDRSAVGEVRYGTAAPLAHAAKAPVFARSQAVTLDLSGFDPKDSLYYQLYWVDRQQLSGLSEVRPLAPTPPRPEPVAAAPAGKARASQLLVFGGPAYRGGHWTWNGGAAYRAKSLPLEAALEGSQYSNSHTHGYPSVGLSSKVRVTNIGTRLSYLHPIEWPRGPHGKRLIPLPGLVRIGAGMALYLTKTRDLETHEWEPHRNQDATERDTAFSPFLELALIQPIGWRLEAQAGVGYGTSKVQFGSADYRPGGLFATLQLACRLK